MIDSTFDLPLLETDRQNRMSNNVNQANFIIKWKLPTAPAEAPYYPLCPAQLPMNTGARGPDFLSGPEPVHSSDNEA